MNFFNRLSFKKKLFLSAIFPLVILIGFSIDKIFTALAEKHTLEIIGKKMNEIKLISPLVHEIQKERDYSVLYINKATFDSKVKLQEQVKQTDSVIRALKLEALKSDFDTSFFIETRKIQKVRKEIEGFRFTYEEADVFFSSSIERLIDRISALGTSTNTEKTNDPIRAYISLVHTKESLGRMRTTLNKAFDMGIFDGLDYGKFAGEKGAFESNMKSFMKLASTGLNDNFQRDFNQGSVAKMLEMIEFSFSHPQDKLYAYTAEDWWISSTSALNIVYSVEESALAEIDLIIRDDIKQANIGIELTILLIVLTIFIVISWVIFSIRSVNTQMRILSIAANKIKDGNTDVQLEVVTNDSIGDLTKAFLSLVQNTKELAEVANKIGQGNYNVPMNIRGPHDILATSIINMQESLKMTTAELGTTVEELKLSNQYKSEFLANMSHELRTPLNSLLILSKILMDNKEKNLTQDQIDCASVIYKSGSSLLVLINDILDLSKIEAGKLDIEMGEVDIKEVLSDLNNLFKPLAEQKSVQLEIEMNTKYQTFQSDKHRLGQILKNMISNAIKFTPEGGKVTIQANDFINERGKLQVGMYSDVISFAVIDTGIGIPKSKQQHVFEAFRQADGSISRNFGGTGLGLSITKKLVALLEGEILLESEEGKGTTFTVVFPVQGNGDFSVEENQEVVESTKQDEWMISSEEIIDTANLKGKTVVFFTKEIMHLFSVNSLFEKYSMDVIDASDISEFQEKIKAPHHVVIIDSTDLTEEEISVLGSLKNILWIGAQQENSISTIPFTEKELLEKIKNIISNV